MAKARQAKRQANGLRIKTTANRKAVRCVKRAKLRSSQHATRAFSKKSQREKSAGEIHVKKPSRMDAVWCFAKDEGLSYSDIYENETYNPGKAKTKKAISRGVERHRVRLRGMQATIAEPLLLPSTQEAREKWENSLLRLPNVIRFAFVSDLHVPDQDARAIDLAAQIVYDYRPHILQHGSDAFDFRTISRFEIDPSEVAEDVFEKVATPYAKIMRIF
ncbi:hypothetical protein LCGC14_1584780, partial [marine sediment metagenome]